MVARSAAAISPQNGPTSQVPQHDDKPVASGYGVLLYIILAEPMLFLEGFDHCEDNGRRPAMLRGRLVMRVTKAAKIKAINLSFRGRARTEWPEGMCMSLVLGF